MTVDGDQLVRDSLRGVLATADDHESIGAALREQGWAEVTAADGDPAWRVLFEEFAVGLSSACPLDLFLEPILPADGTAAQLIYASGRTGPQQALDARRGRPPYPRGIVRDRGHKPGQYVVVTVTESGHATAAAVGAGDVSLEPVQGLDPDAQLQLAQLHAAPRPISPPSGVAVPALIDRAQVLQSWALRALSQRMLDIAIEYVTIRHQFGRPVGSFQAIKHLLADCAVELESLRAVLAYASDTLDPVAVTAARALAGRTSVTVGRVAQQCTGAMGFSAEFSLHHFVRRAHTYDLMLGPWRRHSDRLGQLILAQSAVPRVGEA
jgi:hypothetical protein